MDRTERRTRMQRMRRRVMDHNIYRWAASILGDLSEMRIKSPGEADPNHAQPPSALPAEAANRKLAQKASIR
jgi:trehalose 6-phosphate synthase